MTDIAVTNRDWLIISDVKASLSSASIAAQPVFSSVTVTTNAPRVGHCRLTRHPAAIIRYAATREFVSPGDIIGCIVDIELIIATRTGAHSGDESSKVQTALHLVNAAKNAINSAPPAAACDWSGDGTFGPAVEFSSPEIDASEPEPWCVIRLPVSFTYVMETPTSH